MRHPTIEATFYVTALYGGRTFRAEPLLGGGFHVLSEVDPVTLTDKGAGPPQPAEGSSNPGSGRVADPA